MVKAGLVLALVGCGKKEPEGECVNPKRKMTGCCAGHGGAKKCGDDQYRFQGDVLICDDGTPSTGCRR